MHPLPELKNKNLSLTIGHVGFEKSTKESKNPERCRWSQDDGCSNGQVRYNVPLLTSFSASRNQCKFFWLFILFLLSNRFLFFKIWLEIVPLWLKLCLLRYRENNIGTKVTLSSVNKVRYIKIGRNKNEIFSSPAFPCSANLKSRTRITIVNAKGILLFIPKRKFFVACEAQVHWWEAK